MNLLRVETSRRNFLKLLMAGGASAAIGPVLPAMRALAKKGEPWSGATIDKGFLMGPGYVAAQFLTPGNVPELAAYDIVWTGYNPARFGFWIDRLDLDRTVVTPVMNIDQCQLRREYKQVGISRFGTFPIEPDAEYWLGLSYLDDIMEIQHVHEVRVVPLWEGTN